MVVRSVASRLQVRPWVLVLSLFLIAFTFVIVGAHSLGRLPLSQATFLLLAPVVVLGIALRPAWVVVFILVVPASLLSFVPSGGLVLLALLTIGGQLVTHGRLYVDWRSGMLPVLFLVALAYFYQADAGVEAVTARGFLNLSTFWVLLGLIAYNAVRLRDLDPRTAVTALLVGVTIEALGVTEGSLLLGGEDRHVVGLRRGYAAAIGFSISFGSLLLIERYAEAGKRLLLAALAVFFSVVMIGSLIRAAWVSALLFVIFVARWAGKKRYWFVLPLVLLVITLIPIARERVLPGSSSGFQNLQLGTITTGRTELWSTLWEEQVVPALPFGNGYGHTLTLSPERIFGFQTFQLNPEETSFVFPHNDFIYWMMEFGLIGLFLFLIFWTHLLRVFRRVTRGIDERARRTCFVLAGTLITMFVVQMTDNAFALPVVSERFFIVAGVIFGLRTLVEASSAPKSTGMVPEPPMRTVVTPRNS